MINITNDWEVKNELHMHALKVALISSVLILFGSITYAMIGEGDEQSLAIFMGIIAMIIITQFAFQRPAFVSISKKDSDLLIESRSLFNPINKSRYQLKIEDVINFEHKKGKRIIGGKLIINYKEQGLSSNIIIYLINFSIPRRNKLIEHLSATIK